MYGIPSGDFLNLLLFTDPAGTPLALSAQYYKKALQHSVQLVI